MPRHLYTAAIAECDEDGEMFNTIIQDTDPDSVVIAVNDFFGNEASSGHEVPETEFENFDELDGFDSYDADDCNHYRVVTTKVII